MYGSVILVIMSRKLTNGDELIANSANVKFAPSSRSNGGKFCVAIIIIVLKKGAKNYVKSIQAYFPDIQILREISLFWFETRYVLISRKIVKCFITCCTRNMLAALTDVLFALLAFFFFRLFGPGTEKYIKHLAHKNIKVSKWSKSPWQTFFVIQNLREINSNQSRASNVPIWKLSKALNS